LLLRHAWPGNVRELQSQILQAVILCESEVLGPAELRIAAEFGAYFGRKWAAHAPYEVTENGDRIPIPASHSRMVSEHANEDSVLDPDLALESLRAALSRQIDGVIATGKSAAVPLGKWLADDLVLEAYEAGGRVARRSTKIVGLPETTFLRRLRKASREASAGLSPRSNSWQEVRDALARLVRASDHENGGGLLDQAQRVLLEEVIKRFPNDARIGAALLGVTPPTFRRRLALLQAEPEPAA
jgi:DNA-binding NtrC family response regulator